MPITQDRMITLCDEALAQRTALARLRDEVLSILRQHRNDPLMAITLIEGTLAILQIPPCDNIIAENVHFRNRRRENESNKARMRRKRDTPPGVQPNAPLTLIRPLAEADFEGLGDLAAEYEKWNKGEL